MRYPVEYPLWLLPVSLLFRLTEAMLSRRWFVDWRAIEEKFVRATLTANFKEAYEADIGVGPSDADEDGRRGNVGTADELRIDLVGLPCGIRDRLG